VVETGITPRAPTTLTFATRTDFASDCAQSRIRGGVHFRAAVEAPKAICAAIGTREHRFLQNLLQGNRDVAP
jgi:hypothetical protein